ncbi:MAG: FAD-binding oxidoreductase [Alphaproteobacteria bacterium]|nr:FAD-binding oxidoreductase [Alphaproteobacteria bacterium]MCB9930140.1 FAD-binding oxidoreductase [Alphaproteobacteria bacterium]
MSRTADIVIIGGGMAGASAGYFLAGRGRRVVLLEREERCGYHTTGRSAALYSQAYGNPAICALTIAGEAFYDNPPAGFADHPLLSPRGALFVGRADQSAAVEAAVKEGQALVPSVRLLDAAEARAISPALRPDYVACAGWEPNARDIDVDALHQGFLRGLRAQGGEVVVNAEVQALERSGGQWRVRTGAGEFSAPIVVNAAGAWADTIGRMAGCRPVGCVPKRRTAFLFEPPASMDSRNWPLTVDVDEQWYFKPDAGLLLGSPADETPVEPHDAYPEEMDIALGADRIQAASTLEIRAIKHSWAGLRSFVADKTPVAGYAPAQEGFFWLCGQGGYGIQTAPGLGAAAAALVEGEDLPEAVRGLGLTAAALAPERLFAKG